MRRDPHGPHGGRAARPGSVSRCRTSSAEWHIMSLSTPPPCSSPCQNQGACGPLCSSAARARYGRPVVAAPRAQSSVASRLDLRREQLVLEVAVLSPTRVGEARAPASPRRRCGRAASRRRCPRSVPLPRLDRVRRSPRRSRCARGSDRRARARRSRDPPPSPRSSRSAARRRRRGRAPVARRSARSARWDSRRRARPHRAPRERPHVEAGDEAAADEPDAEPTSLI